MSKLADLMREDPLLQAERLTGQSHKEDEGTLALGFLLHLSHGEAVRRAAEAEMDTHYNVGFSRACAIFGDLGFDEVLLRPIQDGDKKELFVVLWHPAGILGTIESYYQRTRVNSSRIYYNVEFERSPEGWPFSSGRYAIHDDDRLVWSGHHDARVGLRVSMAGLLAEGRFLSRWVDQPPLDLVDYVTYRSFSDNFNERIAAANQERDRVIGLLPRHVQRAIRGES